MNLSKHLEQADRELQAQAAQNEIDRIARVHASYSYARDDMGDQLWRYFEGQLALAGAELVWLAPLGYDLRMVACVSTHCQGARRYDQRGAPQMFREAVPCCPYCDRPATACWDRPCFALGEILDEGHAATNSWLEATDAPFRVGGSN